MFKRLAKNWTLSLCSIIQFSQEHNVVPSITQLWTNLTVFVSFTVFEIPLLALENIENVKL